MSMHIIISNEMKTMIIQDLLVYLLSLCITDSRLTEDISLLFMYINKNSCNARNFNTKICLFHKSLLFHRFFNIFSLCKNTVFLETVSLAVCTLHSMEVIYVQLQYKLSHNPSPINCYYRNEPIGQGSWTTCIFIQIL